MQSLSFASALVFGAASPPELSNHALLDSLLANPKLHFDPSTSTSTSNRIQSQSYSSPLLLLRRRLDISNVCKDELDILWSEEGIDDPAEFLSTKSALSKGCWGSSSSLNCDFDGLTLDMEESCAKAGGVHHNIRIQGGCEMSDGMDGEFDLVNVPFCTGKSCDFDNLIEGLTGYADQCFLEFSGLDSSNGAVLYLILALLMGVVLTVGSMLVVRRIKARNAWFVDRLNVPRSGRDARGSQAPTLIGNDHDGDGLSDVDTFIDHARIGPGGIDHARFGSHRLRYDPTLYSESGLSQSGREGSLVSDDISYITDSDEVGGLVEVRVH